MCGERCAVLSAVGAISEVAKLVAGPLQIVAGRVYICNSCAAQTIQLVGIHSGNVQHARANGILQTGRTGSAGRAITAAKANLNVVRFERTRTAGHTSLMKRLANRQLRLVCPRSSWTRLPGRGEGQLEIEPMRILVAVGQRGDRIEPALANEGAIFAPEASSSAWPSAILMDACLRDALVESREVSPFGSRATVTSVPRVIRWPRQLRRHPQGFGGELRRPEASCRRRCERRAQSMGGPDEARA